MTAISPTFVAACVVGIFWGLYRFTPVLDKFKRQSATDAASELLIADRRYARQMAENAELRAAKLKLEQEALSPILEQLHQNAQLQASVLDRLIHHNGSFKHMEESMEQIAEGFKLLTGFIAELHGLRVQPPAPRKPRERKTT